MDRTASVKRPKIFVLDTNVVLHDSRAIYSFQENDVYIPVTVIEELDKFKKGDDILSFNARNFVRELDKISCNSLFEKGISLGRNKGIIKIEMGHAYTQEMRDSLCDDIPDHRIIATAMWLHQNMTGRTVILVTKDINMRLKAKALGLMAQDYLTGHIEEKKVIRNEKEIVSIKKVPSKTNEAIAKGVNSFHYSALGISKRPRNNQLFKIFLSGQESIPARFNGKSDMVERILPIKAFNISARNQEQMLAMNALMDKDIDIVALTGYAGTGKTLLALACALEQADDFDSILLSRPVIPLKNQDLGFIPGSINNKISPYMLPLFDNLTVIKNNLPENSDKIEKIEQMLNSKKLQISPLAYIRGRSLSKTFFIVDESQNLTPHEIKTIITRASEGTKLVFTGDLFQIDQPYLDINSNGLAHLCEGFRGQEVFEHVNLIKGERSKLSQLAGRLL